MIILTLFFCKFLIVFLSIITGSYSSSVTFPFLHSKENLNEIKNLVPRYLGHNNQPPLYQDSFTEPLKPQKILSTPLSFFNSGTEATAFLEKLKKESKYDEYCPDILNFNLIWKSSLASPVMSPPVIYTSHNLEENLMQTSASSINPISSSVSLIKKKIFFSSFNNFIYAYDGYGEPLPGWPLEFIGSQFLTSPLLFDVDGDGNEDLVVVDVEGNVFWIRIGEEKAGEESIQIEPSSNSTINQNSPSTPTSSNSNFNTAQYLSDYHLQLPPLHIRKNWVEKLQNMEKDEFFSSPIFLSSFDTLSSTWNNFDGMFEEQTKLFKKTNGTKIKMNEFNDIKKKSNPIELIKKQQQKFSNKDHSAFFDAEFKGDQGANVHLNKEDTKINFGNDIKLHQHSQPVPAEHKTIDPKEKILETISDIKKGINEEEALAKLNSNQGRRLIEVEFDEIQEEDFERDFQDFNINFHDDMMYGGKEFDPNRADEIFNDIDLERDNLQFYEGFKQFYYGEMRYDINFGNNFYYGEVRNRQLYDDYVTVPPHVLASPALGDIDNDGSTELIFPVSYFYDYNKIKLYYKQKLKELKLKKLDILSNDINNLEKNDTQISFDEINFPLNYDQYVANGISCFDTKSQTWLWMVHLDLSTAPSYLFSNALAEAKEEFKNEMQNNSLSPSSFDYFSNEINLDTFQFPINSPDISNYSPKIDVSPKKINALLKREAKIFSTPILVDLDLDNYKEIVVTTGLGFIYSLDALSGYTKTGFPFQMGPIVSSPSITNLIGGKKKEIIVGDLEGNIVCLNNLAEVIWSNKVEGEIIHTPIIVDMNEDGQLDVVITANIKLDTSSSKKKRGPNGEIIEDIGVSSDKFESLIWAFDGETGKALDGFPIALPLREGISSPLIAADLQTNYNGEESILSARRIRQKKRMFDINEIESKLRGNNGTSSQNTNYSYSISISPHLIVSSVSGYLYILSITNIAKISKKLSQKEKRDDPILCSQRIDLGGTSYLPPLISDLTDDGYLDLLTTNSKGELSVFSTNSLSTSLNFWETYPKYYMTSSASTVHGDISIEVSQKNKLVLKNFMLNFNTNFNLYSTSTSPTTSSPVVYEENFDNENFLIKFSINDSEIKKKRKVNELTLDLEEIEEEDENEDDFHPYLVILEDITSPPSSSSTPKFHYAHLYNQYDDDSIRIVDEQENNDNKNPNDPFSNIVYELNQEKKKLKDFLDEFNIQNKKNYILKKTFSKRGNHEIHINLKQYIKKREKDYDKNRIQDLNKDKILIRMKLFKRNGSYSEEIILIEKKNYKFFIWIKYFLILPLIFFSFLTLLKSFLF